MTPDCEAALDALERLVREEYPDLPLHEIAATWGGATDDEIAALRRLRPTHPSKKVGP